MKKGAALLAVALMLGGCDRAPGGKDAGQAAPSAHAATGAPRTAAMRAYDEAAARMHAGMGPADRDPDIAFARGMIAHHRGAIDMARVELRHGTDPEMRALASGVIAAQEREIAAMERWMRTRNQPPATNGPSAHAH